MIMSAPPRGRGYAMKVVNKGDSVQPIRKPGESGMKEPFSLPTQPFRKPGESGMKEHFDLIPQPLRKPGESGMKERFGNNIKYDNSEIKEDDKVLKLCNQIGEMSLLNPRRDLQIINKTVLSLCDTAEHLQSFIDKVVSFGLGSKWNAHAIALFCESYSDVTVENVTLRTLFLRKLQRLHSERNKSYLTIENFLMSATLMCETFYHLKINGICIQVLASPVMDFLGMLIDGGSEKEIEVFYEQFEKCYFDLKSSDANGLENIITKIRKQLISETITVTVRARLLQLFEMILTDRKPFNDDANTFYNNLLKPIVRICD